MKRNILLSATVLLAIATISARDGQGQPSRNFQERPQNAGPRAEARPPQPQQQDHHEQPGQQMQQAQQMQAQQQQKAQQEQIRAQQAQQAQAQQQQKAQQEQMMQAHQQQLKSQEEARRAEEQRVRVQEEQARSAQMQALKMQNEQAGKAREQAQRSLENNQLQQHQHDQNLRPQPEAHFNQQPPNQQNNAVPQFRERGQTGLSTIPGGDMNRRLEEQNGRTPVPSEQHQNQPLGFTPQNRHGFQRTATPPPLQTAVVPIAKAISMPVLQAGISTEDHQHAQAVNHNLEKHLIAVEGTQAPVNRLMTRNTVVNNYFNNYHTVINNHPIDINRQNTNYFQVPAHAYPHWYQQEPGWVYSNGFTLGDSIRVGPDWLRWGWHPYFGPPPEGFVCASDFIPTPWIYLPAYGLWREPGVNGYAELGPPDDYDGPITVEVLEPRHIHTSDPYTGWGNDQIINVVYLYNAFYYPDFGRYGYMNRHGYFIWLNLDDNQNFGSNY